MNNKTNIYLLVISINIIILFLQVCFLKFSGALGLTICILTIYFIAASIIRILYYTSKLDLFRKMDILFFVK